MADAESLRVHGSGERWRIEGRWRPADRQLCNDYLGYLADRRYSPASVRAYAFDLLHFARWLDRARASAWTPWIPTRCCVTWPRAGPSAAPASTTT